MGDITGVLQRCDTQTIQLLEFKMRRSVIIAIGGWREYK